ncbi:MAG: hypothetical protein DRI95_08785 [Bacteroidetes bacterium]|nr:MAG: hypothetical protein DRI95_08785 [Bacteroidota bacterium]
MTIQNYIETINKRYKSGMAREHSYRGDLEELIRELVPGVEITNEPANVTDCGNPDYVITKGKIPIGFIEAKDIGKDINSKTYKEQFDRYRKALDNLIITDYIWFRFYQHGELVHEIKIAEIVDNEIKALANKFEEFENLLQNFCTFIGQTIKSSKKLAVMMAAKARLLQNILERAVSSDEEKKEDSSIKAQYESFKQILIHDLTPQAFADIYAQTLAYGMFAARLHDKTLQDFSRQEAAELIPKTNPFLRRLFGYVAGPDIDDRIKTTVDNLADVFRATNVDALLHNFGKSTQMHDPIIHFYEDFLSAYDPKLRKSRGVWYTPEPVVNFITSFDFQHTFITKDVVERCAVSLQTGEISYLFSLYLYPDKSTDGLFAEEGLSEKGSTAGSPQGRKPNLNMEIVAEIANKLDLEFVAEDNERTLRGFETLVGLNKFAPIDILDYIYAVLHSPTYRKKYKEFLKIDFPRVPYPKTLPKFRTLAKLGSELRQIHLLESPKVEEYITSYPKNGNNTITTKIAKKDWELTGKFEEGALRGFQPLVGLEKGRVWISNEQYFDNIPLVAWEFYIGGYQPAQKWLKDRKQRELSFDDILHYQKIIVALTETDRIMKEIDKIEIE